jgi:hypothetical protein
MEKLDQPPKHITIVEWVQPIMNFMLLNQKNKKKLKVEIKEISMKIEAKKDFKQQLMVHIIHIASWMVSLNDGEIRRRDLGWTWL